LTASGFVRQKGKPLSVSCNVNCNGTMATGNFVVDGVGLHVASTSITTADFTGSSSTVAGPCAVNGVSGGTFSFTLIPGSGRNDYHLTVRDTNGALTFERFGQFVPLLPIGPHG